MAVQAHLGRPGLAWLWDHCVQGRSILPGAAMLELAMAAGKVRGGSTPSDVTPLATGMPLAQGHPAH